tara:strand:+ start:299 stop:532 length:234 start_codon:yes stop_codon:yes gene_type:complete
MKTPLGVIEHFLKHKNLCSTKKETEMQMVYSVYITTTEGNEIRDQSFEDRPTANQYAQKSRTAFNNGARVIIEEKYW